MDWIGFIKDWGAHIMSALGILGGFWVYFRHERKIKIQEKRLNELQIRQMQKAEAKELQADIKCNVIHGNNGSAKIRFVNAGMSDALDVRVQILTPEEDLKSVFYSKQWGPYNMINPQSYREEKISLYFGHPDSLLLHVTWNDAYEKDRAVRLSVPL